MYFDRQIEGQLRRSKRAMAMAWFGRPGFLRPRVSPTALRAVFYLVAAASDAAAILASAIAAGVIYHWLFYDPDGMVGNFALLGGIIAFLFVAPGIVRDEYAFARFSRGKQQLDRVFMLWSVAFVTTIVLAFLGKISSDVSRGTFLIFYFCGFASVCLARGACRRLAARFAGADSFAARRVFLVGYESALLRFPGRHEPAALGLRVVSAAVIRGPDSMEEDLALAAAAARLLRPEDVYILVPWSDISAIEACVDAFLRVPASIHLGPGPVLERFSDLLVDHAGPIASLRLVGRPLTALEVALKRVVDVAGALMGLIALSPLFLLVAFLIKRETPGPALFTQRRYGFNQEPFRIFKFRSMTVAEDGGNVAQARPNDPRITAVGAVLRRWNIDELPQLLNVLRGDMSLVGPRPHALVHDQKFERAVALYARRHNVKPGMTGWAQVNGHRGEITSEGHIRNRVEHDLYYIDHWSVGFDLKILLLTLFSRKAYRNAS